LPQVLAHLRNDGSGGGRKGVTAIHPISRGGRNHSFVIARRLKSRRGDLLKLGSLPELVLRLPQALTHLRNDGSGGIEIATGAYTPFVIHNI
jgi:hypothetical protein